MKRVLITGGAGYVGSVLVHRLLERGYLVKVIDLYIYGDDVLKNVPNREKLVEVKGDIRDTRLLEREIQGNDSIIHLACISNDPSFELNPALGRSINYDSFEPLVRISKGSGVRRFIYASSSSVYGVKEVENVTEDMTLEPLTDYSKYKALCEEILPRYQSDDFTTVTLRPATVCGYSPRQRLDVIVNILTNHAYVNRKIKVFGGTQKRPNIHIEDMVRAYELMLELPPEMIAGKTYNVGYENHTVSEIAEIVRNVVDSEGVELETVPTDDDRSYHISSQRIAEELGFTSEHTIEEAVRDLVSAFESGLLPDSMNDSKYFNIKRMQELDLK